jgi:hypothetical protein
MGTRIYSPARRNSGSSSGKRRQPRVNPSLETVADIRRYRSSTLENEPPEEHITSGESNVDPVRKRI